MGDYWGGLPDTGDYYRTLIHELCHWEFYFLDEYRPQWPWEPDIPFNQQLPTIMAYQYTTSELSTEYLYDNPPAGAITGTAQRMWSGLSCWEDLFNRFNYFSGSHMYSGEIARGVQFDLDHDEVIDTSYYVDYQADTFGDWSSTTNPIIQYPVGDYLTVQ